MCHSSDSRWTAPGLLTTRAGADAIGINYKTLQRYVREGRVVPTIRLPGGQMRWDVDGLKDQLRGRARDEADAENP